MNDFIDHTILKDIAAKFYRKSWNGYKETLKTSRDWPCKDDINFYQGELEKTIGITYKYGGVDLDRCHYDYLKSSFGADLVYLAGDIKKEACGGEREKKWKIWLQ